MDGVEQGGCRDLGGLRSASSSLRGHGEHGQPVRHDEGVGVKALESTAVIAMLRRI